jgi:hypothetical protein
VADVVDMQVSPILVEDGAGGAFVSWMDNRPAEYNWDVYILRIDYDGNWGYPSPAVTGVEDVPHDQGRLVTVTWDASRLDAYPDQQITRYAVWRSLTGPPAYSWALSGEVDAYCQPAYTHTDSTTADSTLGDPAYHYYKIIAHTADPLVFWESNPDGGYSVDNTSPAPPTMLAGEQSHEPEGLILSWDPNPEPDIAHYAVYRGTEEHFEPSSDNRIATPSDPGYFDAEWRWDTICFYKITAWDSNGNESDYAVIGTGEITGGEMSRTPAATYLDRNFPNPFNPSTTISFGLHEEAGVSLRIYDVSGHIVRTLVHERRAAGIYTITWDGTDKNDSPVASGVYFYRLVAGPFSRNRKMILLR